MGINIEIVVVRNDPREDYLHTALQTNSTYIVWTSFLRDCSKRTGIAAPPAKMARKRETVSRCTRGKRTVSRAPRRNCWFRDYEQVGFF